MYYQKSRTKYGAKKTPCNHGHIHDSVKEANRCNELHLLLKAKEIENLEYQKVYMIIPEIKQIVSLKDTYKSGEKKGKNKTKTICIERETTYIADFVYYDKKQKKTVIEDCKGMKTKEYILKRKLMRHKYCDENTIFLET